uniref:Uncharacterized protein n=1 Tax=Otus sunia TaxID=257818 RepID=A0A8C8BQS2_9STRI
MVQMLSPASPPWGPLQGLSDRSRCCLQCCHAEVKEDKSWTCRAARIVRWWPPHPYVISWALSCGFLRSSSASRQWRKLSSVTSGLGLTMILSLWLHTSKPIKATRRRRG